MFAVDPNQNQNGYGDISSGQFIASPNAPYQGSFMTPQLPQQQQSSHQLPPASFPSQTQTFQTQLPNAQPQQFTQSQQQPTVANEPAIQKPPLPEEYIYLQTVFNELRTQCSNATANPVSIHYEMPIFLFGSWKYTKFNQNNFWKPYFSKQNVSWMMFWSVWRVCTIYCVKIGWDSIHFYVYLSLYLNNSPVFIAVNAKHIGFFESIGSAGANWWLCKRFGASHSNGIGAGLFSDRQFYARH